MLESALQSIVATRHESLAFRFPRVQAIASQIQQAATVKVQAVSAEIAVAQQKHQTKLEIKQKAQNLIQKGFAASVSDFQGWLYLPKLLERYQSELVSALQQGTFNLWEQGGFKEAIQNHQQGIVKWVHQASEFFDRQPPTDLTITFPKPPEVKLPEPPPQAKGTKGVTPVAIATGLGWVFGGPVGAAVAGGATYLLKKTPSNAAPPKSSTAYVEQVNQAYTDAATEYLTCFSREAVSALEAYEKLAETVINVNLTNEPLKLTIEHHQLQLLQNVLANLEQELERVRLALN
jgi:hypothetical protein